MPTKAELEEENAKLSRALARAKAKVEKAKVEPEPAPEPEKPSDTVEAFAQEAEAFRAKVQEARSADSKLAREQSLNLVHLEKMLDRFIPEEPSQEVSWG